ncbi:Crp/Fnr family transcriptional regulator [Pontibacter indicus]|uniref:cAMP-binding domain of CRP or a regulatory subunit of cAMP-dependent protein kinases n=1 Tax=Pontibacter indicus TaxID=1317125 RepID=A0A1R3XHJ8_9BACT|nr:Crp/Fnr family transcriptional regulator [Pontibacter indicus]SIT90527.1 cAMP-binding domain of CRP or a regulatory subunit of cAMP-dependent protein kinases [Pontibacter indicus]
MNALHHCISQYYPISIPAWEALSSALTRVELPKNAFLVREGTVCNKLYFLERGCLRGYYNLDGKEVTYWFGFEHNFITSFYSFISRKPGIENIQVLEDSTLWGISSEALHQLFDAHHDLERLVRIINEQYYIRLEERLMAMQFKTARERYEQLLGTSPHILQRIPLGQIASYLGISQETLSRIRSQV